MAPDRPHREHLDVAERVLAHLLNDEPGSDFVYEYTDATWEHHSHTIRILDQRQTLTVGAANDARAAARRYENKLNEYEATIRQARAESYQRLEASRTTALDERRQVIDAAKQQTADQISRARADLERQAAAARQTLETESRQIAENISRTILGRTVGGGAD